MKLIVKKEIEGEKNNEYSFSIEANGIKTKGDIHEVIHQCRLVENQLTDESTFHPAQNYIKGGFVDQPNGSDQIA
jgi:hypothetical protein